MLLAPGLRLALHPLGIARIERLETRLLGVVESVPAPHRLRGEGGDKGHHHHPAVLGQQAEDVVRHVARMVVQGAGRGVGEDHRRRRDGDRLPHRLGRHVREVDQHAEPVHLAHHLLAEAGETAVLGRVGRRVGPVGVLGMGERHVTRARHVELAQGGERVVDRMPPLHADQRGDAPGLVDAHHVVRRERQLEGVGIALGQPVDVVDLLHHRLDGVRPLDLDRDVDRPELAAEPPLTQARDVGVHGRIELRGPRPQVDLVQVVLEPLAVLPREVVVAVDERHLAQQLARPLDQRRVRSLVDSLLRQGCAGAGQQDGKQEGSRWADLPSHGLVSLSVGGILA